MIIVMNLQKKMLTAWRIVMVNVKSYVRINEEHTEAWLYLCAPETQNHYEKSEILRFIQNNKVVAGINESNVAAMCKKKIYDREVKIATSELGEPGHEGYFEFFFETGKKKPKINIDGSVDYRSMSLVESVEEGDLVARYHPAEQGTSGRDVMGAFEKPVLYKDLRPLTGKGITHEEGSNDYYAATSGKIEYDGNNKISIVEVYEVSGNCDLTNNPIIEFNGDIVISGNVEAGVVIRAGKSVTVEGVVESANITAGGDVCLKRGMQGAGKGIIRAGGDVFTEFIEYAQVEAKGSVQANVILSSNVNAGQTIMLTGKKGLIAGGKIHATMGITCMNAGNQSEIKTQIHVGVQPEIMEKRASINEEYDKANKELDELVGGMAKILRVRQQTGELSEQLQEYLENLKSRKDEVYARCMEAKKKADEVEELVIAAREASIKVMGNLYHGVVIGVDNHQMPINKDTSFMEYKALNGVIVGTVIVA